MFPLRSVVHCTEEGLQPRALVQTETNRGRGSLVDRECSYDPRSYGCFRSLPHSRDPVAFGIDANTPIKWIAGEDGFSAVGKEHKGENMLEAMLERDFVLCPPLTIPVLRRLAGLGMLRYRAGTSMWLVGHA